jgi:hypothetical protein
VAFALCSRTETYIKDLAACDYFPGRPAKGLTSVGWLAREHAYPVRQAELPGIHFRQLLRQAPPAIRPIRMKCLSVSEAV